MEKPRNYDNVSAYTGGNPLAPGGYVCKVINIAEETSRAGRPMVKIALDIAEGEEAGRFSQIFYADTRPDRKWPNSGVMYQLTTDDTGDCSRGFKTLTEALENDNVGFQIAWGPGFCQSIKGKLLGVVFRREEYLTEQGEKRMSCKPYSVRSIADIRGGKVKAPADKLLNNKTAYNADPFSGPQWEPVQAEDPGDSFQAIDEQVPF